MKPLAKAIVETGLVDPSIIQEMKRWGAPIYDPGTEEEPVPGAKTLATADDLVAHIREALESMEQVRIDETDLDLLHRYLDKKHQKEGKLLLRSGGKRQSKLVSFCITPTGEYALPWTDRDLEPSILYNGETHLKWSDNGVPVDVRFSDARDVFFGTQRAFVVCEVSK
jgi:hypothetical protein